MRLWNVLLLAAGMTLASLAGPAAAQAPGGNPAASSSVAVTTLSATQREAIARELIARWGKEVTASPGGSLVRWSARLRSEIASGDAANILRATSAPTLDLMHAALVGYVPTSADVEKSAASVLGRSTISNGTVAPRALGDTLVDLVYTPLTGRCRIADSRVLGPPLAASTTRNLLVSPATSYTAQGGSGTFAGGNSNTACGIPPYATAYALSISVLSPQGNGSFKVFTYGESFQTGPGIIVNAGTYGSNNNVIVKACFTCLWDISVQSAVQAHFLIDVIGYFMPPVATALSCTTTAQNEVSVSANGGTANATAPSCASGYTQTSTNCETSSWLMPLVYSSGGTCSARNGETTPQTLRASRVCCRVPGR